jgi:cytochrome b involved in lipid metabolism
MHLFTSWEESLHCITARERSKRSGFKTETEMEKDVSSTNQGRADMLTAESPSNLGKSLQPQSTFNAQRILIQTFLFLVDSSCCCLHRVLPLFLSLVQPVSPPPTRRLYQELTRASGPSPQSLSHLATPPPERTMSKTISAQEVKAHSSPEKGMYIVVDENVYDITNFVDEHPGGAKILKRVAGKDATKQFWKCEC